MWRYFRALALILALLAGCKQSPTRPAATTCPSGKVKGPTGHCYEAVLAPGLSWYDAKLACESRGGHLVTITSQIENDFVFSLVSDINAFWYLDMYGNGLGPWLGGYQEAGAPEPDGGWHWVTDEPWVYTNWEYGQPDNAGILNQNALRFFKEGGLIGSKWDDGEAYNAVEHRLGYICEYE